MRQNEKRVPSPSPNEGSCLLFAVDTACPLLPSGAGSCVTITPLHGARGRRDASLCLLHIAHRILETGDCTLAIDIESPRSESTRANMTILPPFLPPSPFPFAGDARARGGAVHETRPHREDPVRDGGGGPRPARRRGLARVCGMALTRQDLSICHGRGRGDLRQTDGRLCWVLRIADWSDALRSRRGTGALGQVAERNRGTEERRRR